MCIPITDNIPTNTAQNEFRYEVKLFEATTNNQSKFIITPPNNANVWYPFLVFRGSRLMDVTDEYEYDDVTNILTITDPACYLLQGRHLTIVFLNKSYTDIKNEIFYIKMEFPVAQNGLTQIPPELYKTPTFQFDSSNLLLFINGVYLEPDRWSITQPGNNIQIISSTSGYWPPIVNKTFTAVYILQQPDPDLNYTEFREAYSQKEIDPSEDNDKLRFDELYSYVEKKP